MKLAPHLTIPPDAVSRTIGILAQKGAGKTYTGMKLAELMLDISAQIVCLDPTGVWWGLQADGDGPGYPIIVMGGEHAHVPLAHTSGAIVAEFIVKTGQSVILDLSGFMTNSQIDQFVAEFAERLYALKGTNRTPMHLMLDEADFFAPQEARRKGYQIRMLGAIEAIVRRGRSRGLGMTMISQRPAVLNKNVLTQCDLIIAMRIVGVQDHKALKEWTAQHGTADQQKRFLEALPTLPDGTGFFWSPEWLKCFESHHVSKRKTFDSSSTPEVGKKTKGPKLAKVDLGALTAEIQKTIEEKEANDPAKLRGEVRRLEIAHKAAIEEIEHLKTRKPEGFSEADKKLIRGVKDAVADLLRPLPSLQKQLEQLVGLELAEKIMPAKTVREVFPHGGGFTSRLPAPPPKGTGFNWTAEDTKRALAETSAITGGKRRMMIALAQRPGLSARQLGVRAGLSSSSGSFGTYLANLRSAGYMEGSRDAMRLTPEGIKALGSYDPLPTGRALLEFWISELGSGGASRILQALAAAYPRAMSKAELGEATELSHNSGSFGTYLSKLRTLELIHGSAELKASEELFD